MKNSSHWWIVTDLDGTLMDDNYEINDALATLSILKSYNIPVIPCTSKTASEVRNFREKFNLTDPYIVENGASIYGNDPESNSEWELSLGSSYDSLRTILSKLEGEFGHTLMALNDLTKLEIVELTGLDMKSVELCCDRYWSVPFLNPHVDALGELNRLASKYDTKVLQGNRMSHLVSKHTDKGRALLELKQFLSNPTVITIGLGDSPNDLPLLDISDISIVVPGKNGPHPEMLTGIQERRYILAPASHSLGWSLAIRSCLDQHIKF